MIQNQINAITKALSWIKKHKPEQYDKQFSVLVEERLKLRKIQAATLENPAIAAYGESQKGKSHVMNNLLLKNGEPYKVETLGGPVDFITRINPVTHGTEATGVVTRFSAFENADGTISSRYKPEHPVLIKLLSPTDMAMILCDSYFFDTDEHSPHPMFNEIENFGAELLSKYESAIEQESSPVIEDDIFDMRNYMRSHIGTRAQNYYESNYFYNLARVIRRIPVENIPDAFSILWNNNRDLTALYRTLLKAHMQLGFANEVYCNIDAVDNRQNTIMAVVCLEGLNTQKFESYDSDAKRYVTIYREDKTGREVAVENFRKCDLAALCREVVFKIDAAALAVDVRYDLSAMPDETKSLICSSGFRKDILHTNDLLDFPGARPRETYPVDELKIDIMVKRGKVAYLFHKYSEGHIFNVLLFCQNNTNMNVTDMYELIGQWVHTYVGKTPEERARMIQRTQVPPIFVIGTMFNNDMKESGDTESNTDAKLNERWKEFFDKIMWNEALKAETAVDKSGDLWFKNWLSGDGRQPFDNTYVLRDFKYSSKKSGGNLYDGYDQEQPNSKELSMMMSRDYYDRMRQTFIENPYVQRFFRNPALTWDVAATINNDGIQYIIERLSIVARNINKAREEQFKEKTESIARKVVDLLRSYYINEDGEELLKANVKKAKKVTRELDFTVQQDNYFFGHLIEQFQITERETYNELHHLVTSGALTKTTNDFHSYEIIRSRCGEMLDRCSSDAEKWEVIMDEYGLDDEQEAAEYLSRRGIDPNVLFGGKFQKKINSVTIADKVFDTWNEKLNSHKIIDEMTGENSFDSIVMGHLTEDIAETAKQLSLPDRLAELIQNYVNVLNPETINQSLVADLLATEINNFVNDLGFHYRDEKEIEKLQALSEEKRLNCFEAIGAERKETFTEEELSAMFDELNDNENTVTPSFRINYDQWVEYMKISFVGKSAVGDYDRLANHEMGEIINMANS